MDNQGIKQLLTYTLITQKEYITYLYHICGKTLGSMDTLKRHLNYHTNETYKYLMFKYTSPRMDAIRRHSSRQRAIQAYNGLRNQTLPSEPILSKQLPLSKNKEAFSWILHELDTLPLRISRPYHINEPIIIPQEAVKQLPDPRLQQQNNETIETMKETTSISSKRDKILNQDLEISTFLSELDYLLRQLKADETGPSPNYTEKEETEAWTVLDSFGTIAMDEI